jgi:hypothetical protein
LNKAQHRPDYSRRGKSACPPVSSRDDIRAEYISHRDCGAPVGIARTEGLVEGLCLHYSQKEFAPTFNGGSIFQPMPGSDGSATRLHQFELGGKILQYLDAQLCNVSGYVSYDTSLDDLERLLADEAHLVSKRRNYIAGFSPNMDEVIIRPTYDFTRGDR